MSPPLPMLGEFAVRLAGGLALALLVTPRRLVPPHFFRTQCQVLLALWVLAALVVARPPWGSWVLDLAIAGAVLSFLGTVAWGLGLPRIALPITLLLAAVAGSLLAWESLAPTGGASRWPLVLLGRWGSAALLGTTLSAMLLGHHYLTSPAMSIAPLQRLIAAMAVALAVRAAIAGFGLVLDWPTASAPAAGLTPSVPVILAIRWGMGLIGPGVACFLAWRTALIRSTQSATGILYIGMILVLFGEVSAIALSRSGGLLL